MQFIQKNCRQFKVFIVHDARELAQGKGEQLIKVLTSFMRQFKHSGTNKFVLQNSVTPLFLRYDEQDTSEQILAQLEGVKQTFSKKLEFITNLTQESGPILTSVTDVPGQINPHQEVWQTELGKYHGKWYPNMSQNELKGFLNMIEVIVDNFQPNLQFIQPWTQVADAEKMRQLFFQKSAQQTHVSMDLTSNQFLLMKESFIDNITKETNFTKNEFIIEAYHDLFNTMISTDFQGQNTNNLAISLQDEIYKCFAMN